MNITLSYNTQKESAGKIQSVQKSETVHQF